MIFCLHGFFSLIKPRKWRTACIYENLIWIFWWDFHHCETASSEAGAATKKAKKSTSPEKPGDGGGSKSGGDTEHAQTFDPRLWWAAATAATANNEAVVAAGSGKIADYEQNLHWKLGQQAPHFGSILAVRLKKYFFFRSETFLFFKMENWNFLHLFEIYYRNFKFISAILV